MGVGDAERGGCGTRGAPAFQNKCGWNLCQLLRLGAIGGVIGRGGGVIGRWTSGGGVGARGGRGTGAGGG